ncbi:MAG: MmgE/PrpD family protein [Pseudomonadales bacterium]|nr:MmgE/PrpD family protein [Pseudomonadales bacterium]
MSKNPTAALAKRITEHRFTDLPPEAVEVTKQCLLDYIGVTFAGSAEPLSEILLQDAQESGCFPQASIIGRNERLSLDQAALINGSASHAHDYDDVHSAMSGHPTVPVAPAVFALGEHLGVSGRAMITAFATGIDAECLVGTYMGGSHYHKGFHATGTVGTFGAAAASAKLLELSQSEIQSALGIAGTQAAGLKAQFGTMCKPLHAGRAAATGLQSAKLAAKGFSSHDDILSTERGFGATQSNNPSLEKFFSALKTPSFVPGIAFKYHSACFLTHSSLEAIHQIKREHSLTADTVQAVDIHVAPGHFGVCNILEPKTGLEIKFSLRFTAAMALFDLATSQIDIYTDELSQDPALIALRDKVTVHAFDKTRRETIVNIRTAEGEYSAEADVTIPQTDLDAQRERLQSKFRALTYKRLGEAKSERILELVNTLEQQEDMSELFALLRTLPNK